MNLLTGKYLKRIETRLNLAKPFQLPPRHTRPEPPVGPVGLVCGTDG